MTLHKPAIHKLKFHSRRKHPATRLPFAGRSSDDAQFKYWDIPKLGGYSGGCKTGEALARIYLQFLREKERDSGGLLQRIVLCMSAQSSEEETTEEESLRGQIVGFFCEIDRWLEASAKHFDDGLQSQTRKELLKIANNGINLDEAGYFASFKDIASFKGSEN